MIWPIRLLTEEEAKALRAKQCVYEMHACHVEASKVVMRRLMHEMNALTQWTPMEPLEPSQVVVNIHGRKSKR